MELKLTDAEKMRVIRNRKGLTVTKIAKEIEVDQSNLTKYELARKPFPAHVWEKYKDYIEQY